MNAGIAEVSLKDIIAHAELALDAIGELNFSISNLNRFSRQSHRYYFFYKEVFNSINLFIDHACKISILLWPQDAQRDESAHTPPNQAIKNIKRRLGYGNRQLLKNEPLRNKLGGHIECPVSTRDFNTSEYETIGLFTLVAYSCQDKKICCYDPMSRNFYWGKDAYNIQDVAAAIFKLLFYAREELQKQRTMIRADFIPAGQFLGTASMA